MLFRVRAFYSGAFLLFIPLGYVFAQVDLEPVSSTPLAEETLVDDGGVFNETQGLLPGTVSCFDRYQFGSVEARLAASARSTVSGASITFSGSLVNANPYPIVDGALYVKIFKSRGAENDGNGPDVVDQFFVESGVAIPAQGSLPVSFEWKVPAHARSGEYQVATFFTTSRKANLLGLSFTDDVVGNTVPFSVVGEREEGVAFDKAGVTINGEPYFFATFPPRFDASAPVTLSARVENNTKTPQSAKITWSIYQWDAQLRENVVQEEVQTVTVPPGGGSFSFTVSDTRYPVYYAVGTLLWQDTKSIIGARFVREGVDRLRINFPGITSFPIKAGESNELFSCLFNSGASSRVSGGSFDLILTDREGELIHEYRYDGDVTGSMVGLASAFSTEKSYDYVALSARLFQDGEFVDEANLVYDCAQIDPALCLSSEAYATPGILGWLASFFVQIASVVGALLVCLTVLWVYRRFVRNSEPPTNLTA